MQVYSVYVIYSFRLTYQRQDYVTCHEDYKKPRTRLHGSSCSVLNYDIVGNSKSSTRICHVSIGTFL